MIVLQSLMERLRYLVGLNSWDYCVVWKLREDERSLEWTDCCCGGAGGSQNHVEELLFPASLVLPCKDVTFPHPRTKACDLLAQLPSSVLVDFGIHAQALISNQPRWINISNSSETTGTRVLIPVTGGLIELFIAKQVSEDQQIIEFVMAQCNISWEEETMIVRTTTSTNCHEQAPMFSGELGNSPLSDGFPVNSNAINDEQPKQFSANGFTSKNPNNNLHPWISSSTAMDNMNLPWDLSVDQMRLCNSPLNFGGPMQQFAPSSDSIILDTQQTAFNSSLEDNGFHDTNSLQQSVVTKELGQDKDSVKQEPGRAGSVSDCSDQVEDDDDQKVVGRGGKQHQSKNLVAERNRRKKLNDRLYELRSLVPKITKMDRASILGDAIEFVKELQKKAEELQDELEQPMDEDGDKNCDAQLEIPNQNGVNHGAKLDHNEPNTESKMGITDHGTGRCSSFTKTTDSKNSIKDPLVSDNKSQQMEVQVEVTQVDGNEFYLKVFCEHNPGGFVRLMEAMNSLGLLVTNANVTTFRGLVLNIFRVEKMDNEMVQADHVRESLLEFTRNPTGGWSEPTVRVSENGSAMDYHHHHFPKQQTQDMNSHHHQPQQYLHHSNIKA